MQFNIDSPNMVTVAVAQHQIVIPFMVSIICRAIFLVLGKARDCNRLRYPFFQRKILDLVADREQLDMPTLFNALTASVIGWGISY